MTLKKERYRKWKLEYFKVHPQKRLLWAARKRAKLRGLEFTITEKDIHIPKVCPYLGIELVIHTPRGQKRDNCISLDRIDNDKGYTPDNIEVISQLANTMKNKCSSEFLIKFAKEILKRYE